MTSVPASLSEQDFYRRKSKMKLGFLGYGHLARAIDSGIKLRGLLAPENICVCAKSQETLALAKSGGHRTALSAGELFENCDLIVLAIKPKVFREMKPELAKADVSGKRIVSVMASVSLDELKSVFACPVLRVIPTIAISGARDVIGCLDSDNFADVFNALSSLGDVIKLDEPGLDRLTVAASCGLGFAAHILEAYRLECVRFGFSEAESGFIVRQIFGFAAEENDFNALRTLVATKGGSTEAGITAMNDELSSSLRSAFDAAAERAIPKK